MTKIFNTFYPAHNSHNDKESRLEINGKHSEQGEQPGRPPVNQQFNHIHWPPGCTSTFHPVAYTHTHTYTERRQCSWGGVPAEGAGMGVRVSDVVELLQKCETANVKRNTEVNVVAATTTTVEPSNKPTAKCSLPSPLPFLALHALDAVDKALQFACHLLWQLIVGLPSWQTPLGNPLTVGLRAYAYCWRRCRRRLWAIANKKGGKSTLLWHLILILLPYLSIDSGDCRHRVMWHGPRADTFCSLTFDVIR